MKLLDAAVIGLGRCGKNTVNALPGRSARLRFICGALGGIVHIEAHYSDLNSNKTIATWRDLSAGFPGGGMTGSGIHVLDAEISLGGTVHRVPAQLISRTACAACG